MKTALIIFIVSILLSLNSYAQPKSITQKPTPKGIEISSEQNLFQQSVNLRIFQILHQTADEAKGWEDIKISSKIQAQVADLLWDFDPISAENYLVRAWDKAKQAKKSEEKPSKYRNISNRVTVGRDVLLVARKRQPILAEKWLKELSDLAEEDFADRNKGLFDDRTARSAVLLEMALQVVETDVQTAAAMAVESLRDGISFGLQTVLVKIQEKNPELSTQVFRAALQKIISVGITNANEIQILYSYLYTPGLVSTTANSSAQGNTTIAIGSDRVRMTPAANLYPALAQEFLVTAARAILGLPFMVGDENPQNSAREQYGITTTILIKLGNTSPELSRALQERLAAIVASANFSPTQQTSQQDITPIQFGESREEYGKRRLERVLEDAQKISNPLQRDIFLAQGILQSDVEVFELAKSVAEKIDDKELREQILNFLSYRMSLYLIKTDNVDQAYKLLQKNSEHRQKASGLVIGAQRLVEQKDILAARGWLNEAQRLFEKNKAVDEDWINIGFALTAGFAEFDKIDGLKQLEATTKLLNKETNAYNRDKAPLANGFTGLNFSDFTAGTKNFSLNSAVNSFSINEFEGIISSLSESKNFMAKGEAILVLCRRNLKVAKINQPILR